MLNGSYQPDLGTRTAAWLTEQGLNAASEGNVESTPASSMTLQGGAPYALKWLAEAFEMTAGRISHDFIPDAQADLVLILGDDWASNNPMP